MRAVFGLLDFKGKLSLAERLRMFKALGKAAEVRGTDVAVWPMWGHSDTKDPKTGA